ncbi:MAG TPA: prolipoprotein diacylglyceryl transferase [Candidatus Acidoferrales bacterium]|nr:prolipoprotein diacylglyceryl transferase [Candidatus Acidoferrales bacterium]
MHPILFHFGGINVYSYGVLVASGVLTGLWYSRKRAPHAGLDPDKVWNMGIYTVLCALLLAKIWLILSDWGYYQANPRDIFSLNTFQSGGTFYGGIVGALLMIGLYSYFQKMPLLPVMDTLVAGLPLGHAIGRLGCFAAGCCYGKPTTVPWSVTFTNPLAEQLAGTPLGVHLHPTQLYEAAAEFLNFLILVWIGKRQRFTGQIVGTYFLLYGVERCVIEFFRGDPGRTMMFHDTISLMQVVSLALITTGAFLWWRGLRKGAPIASVSAARTTAAR